MSPGLSYHLNPLVPNLHDDVVVQVYIIRMLFGTFSETLLAYMDGPLQAVYIHGQSLSHATIRYHHWYVGILLVLRKTVSNLCFI